jgi:hypothetical protein
LQTIFVDWDQFSWPVTSCGVLVMRLLWLPLWLSVALGLKLWHSPSSILISVEMFTYLMLVDWPNRSNLSKLSKVKHF